MFAKVFSQIFDSSIAENWQTRHVFMDLLVLSDSDGCVDMTAEAIARRTNVPVEIVRKSLEELCAPDSNSRTSGNEGRRLVPIDSNRAWGWHIVNYSHYRVVRDEEARREYHRNYRREERAKKKVVKPKQYHRANGSDTPQSGAAATTEEVNRALRLSEDPPILNGAAI